MKRMIIVVCAALALMRPYAVKAATDGEEPVVEMEEDGLPEGSVVTPVEMAVTLKQISYEDRTVSLQWDFVEGAVVYAVLHQGEEGEEEVARTSENNAEVTVQDDGLEQRYLVYAINEKEEIIGISGEVTVVLPGKISKVETTAQSQSKVKVSWDSSEGATGYLVYGKAKGEEYQLLKTVEEESAVLKVEFGKDYAIQVVPIWEDGNAVMAGASATVTFRNREFVDMGHQRYSYQEMQNDIKALQKKYSEYVRYEVIGQSIEGRDIYDVVLGNPEAENTILVVCTLHAREYVTTVICMKQLEYYLSNYNKTVDGKKLSELFQRCNVHYVMMANPDGVVISQTSNARWKGNSKGVNLNRNFPYKFRVAGNVRDNSYSGKSAASEPETKAIISLTKRLQKASAVAVVNYHAMGNIVFGDYGGSDKSLRSQISQMYKIARNTTGYRDAGGYSGASNGNYREYVMYRLKIPSITIEVGSTSCPVSYRFYKSIYEKNKLVVLREAALMER